MIGFLKYLKGYLRIKVWGFSPERFMNLCSNREILLWDITRDGEIYYMNISLKSFYQLKGIARKTGTRVAICKRYGLPFFMPTLLQKKVFLAGLFLAVFFWFWSSLYIWNIEINGNYQITNDVLLSFLTQNEVKIGMCKSKLQIEELENEIRKTFPQVIWTSAKLSGTKLIIDMKENDKPVIQEKTEEEGGYDFVTEFDGTIVSMIVRNGVPLVNIGDTVEKGTVLVDGKVPIYNDDATIREYTYVRADADILLEHTKTFHADLPFDYVRKEYTGRTKERIFIRLGEREWKMPENRPFLLYDSVIKAKRPLVFEKLSIPVYLGSYTYREYLNVEYEYTLDQAETLLTKKIIAFLKELEEKGVQIIEKNVKIDSSGGKWTIDGEFLVRELVGRNVATVQPDMGEQASNE